MEQSKFSKLMKVLQVAYPYYFKDLDKETSMAFIQLYYNKLKAYQYEIVAKAIDKIIANNNFMPTLAEVIKECDNEAKLYYKDKLQEMYVKGYFKTDEEYGKAIMWLLEDKPLIPGWLKKDIDKYLLTIKKEMIE